MLALPRLSAYRPILNSTIGYKDHYIKIIEFDAGSRQGSKWGISVDGEMVLDERKTIKKWHFSIGESAYDLLLEIAFGNYKIIINGVIVKDEALYPWDKVLRFDYENRYFEITRFCSWGSPLRCAIHVDNKLILDERK